MMEPGAGSQTMCEHEKVNVTGAASSHRLFLWQLEFWTLWFLFKDQDQAEWSLRLQ